MSDEAKFESFGILELLGHLRLAGRVSEQVIAGTALLRIDVPAVDDVPAYTRFFGGASVYSFSPTSEEVALRMARALRARPVQEYQLAPPVNVHRPLIEQDHDDDSSPL